MAQVPSAETVVIADGSTRQFSFEFFYLETADVFVTVDGVAVEFEWLASNTLLLDEAPEAGATVRMYRSTPAARPKYEFQLGAPFLPRYIDENFTQGLYVLQEGLEDISKTELRMDSVESRMDSVENQVENFEIESGYEFLGDYEDGPWTLERYNQVIRYGGEWYRVGGSAVLPYTTGLDWAVDEPNLTGVGDAALRSALGSAPAVGGGALLVNGAPVYLDDSGTPALELPSVAALVSGGYLTTGPLAVTEGQLIRTRAEGFVYQVAAPDAPDAHLQTAEGVRLYTTPSAGGTLDIRQFGEVGPDSDSTAILQRAMDTAAASGYLLTGAGVVRIDSKFVIKGACDLSRLELRVHGAPAVAVEVSTGEGDNPETILDLERASRLILPDIINTSKPVTGWAGQGIGLRYVNVQNAQITEQTVAYFAIGVQHTSYKQGCGYSTVMGGYLRNNRVNRHFTVGVPEGSFTNRWDILGGRYFHSSAEGVAVLGVRHIVIEPIPEGNILNDFNFFGASLEGNAQDYQVVHGGAHANFYGCRWETQGGSRILCTSGGLAGQGAGLNIVHGRGNDSSLNVTVEGDASGSMDLQGTGRGGIRKKASEPFIYQNSSTATAPAYVVFSPDAPIGGDPDSDYSTAIGPREVAGKRTADTHARVRLDCVNGALQVGNANAAPTAGVAALGAQGMEFTGDVYLPVRATPNPVTGRVALWFDGTDLRIRLPNGDQRTIQTS